MSRSGLMEYIVRIFYLSVILFILYTTGISAYNTPQWQTGNWWDLDTNWDADFNGDIPAELSFTELNNRYSITEIAYRTPLHGSQTEHEVFILEFTGLLFGDGIIHLAGPFPLNLDVRIPDTQTTGEVWIDTQTFQLVSWTRSFESPIEAYQGGEWEIIGNISLNLHYEWDPARNLSDFPFELNDEWIDNHTLYWFGDYRIYVDLFSSPEEDIQSFDTSTSRSFEAEAKELEEINGYDSVRINHVMSLDVIENVWYSPEPGWYARYESAGTGTSGVFFVPSWNYDLTDFGETPSTPEPTRTPMPPTITQTPSEPTDTPVPPTGTQPTPTQTYTLPPWIPPTRTPTAGPPTETPTPPTDRPSIRIQSNEDVYHAEDHFLLTTTITNPTAGLFVMEYIIFDFEDGFWFWPEWSEEIGGQFRILPGGSSFEDEVILEFDWPDIPVALENLVFWAFLTEPTGYEIIGDFGFCTFRYE